MVRKFYLFSLLSFNCLNGIKILSRMFWKPGHTSLAPQQQQCKRYCLRRSQVPNTAQSQKIPNDLMGWLLSKVKILIQAFGIPTGMRRFFHQMIFIFFARVFKVFVWVNQNSKYSFLLRWHSVCNDSSFSLPSVSMLTYLLWSHTMTWIHNNSQIVWPTIERICIKRYSLIQKKMP